MDNQHKQSPPEQNPFAASGLFLNTAAIWSPYKASFEGFAGGGKTFTMCCMAVGIWMAEGGKGNVVLIDTERSSKFIVPFLRQFGLIEGKNFFVTYSRDLQRWGQILKVCEENRGTIMMTDTVTHIYEQMLVQFEKDNNRRVKYPQDALIIKPMWKEKFAGPFVNASNTHLLFTGRAAWEYTMQKDEDTGKKEFNATGVKMRGDNELAYEPDVVVLMERAQHIDGRVMVARKATILKDRSRLIDGKEFMFFTEDEDGNKLNDQQLQSQVWATFEPVYKVLASGNRSEQPQTESEKAMGPLFVKGSGEQFYAQRLRAERTAEEIAGVYNEWGLGGTGGVEKSVRAILNNLVFGVRSTAALVEEHPDKLAAGVETIDYLSRYTAKNMEFIQQSFKANQFDKIKEFLAEAKTTYEKERYAAKHDHPAIQQPPEDDDIPEFTSSKTNEHPRGHVPPGEQASPPPPEGGMASEPEHTVRGPASALSPEDKEAVEVATTRDIEESLIAAGSQNDLEAKFAEAGAVISKLSEGNRKRIHRAFNTRRNQLKRGGVGTGKQQEATA